MGAPALGCLPALSPMFPKGPRSAKLLSLDSRPHGLILSTVWLKWGVMGDVMQPTLGPGLKRKGGEMMSRPEGPPCSKSSPHHQSETQQLGLGMRGGLRSPVCSLGCTPYGSARRATNVSTPALHTGPVLLGKLLHIVCWGVYWR